MTARERRRVVGKLQAAKSISERRAIRWTGFARSTVRYRSVRPPQDELRARIRELAGERPRWGYRRIHILVRREGWAVNQKRVYRLYREEGLAVRRKGKRWRSQVSRVVREPIQEPNTRWGLDFVSDTLSMGRTFRCFTVVDEYSRESPVVEVDFSLPASRVIEVLERLHVERGLPDIVVTDHGSEFTSRAFDAWAYARGVKIDYIQPGKPIQNCFIESFNGSLRDECLNLHWFPSLEAARQSIEQWRVDYNRVRPHSSLGGRTPEEFASDTVSSEDNEQNINREVVRE